VIALLDIGIGNLRSVESGFKRVGGETIVVQSAEAYDRLAFERTDLTGVVLPGVGAFGDAMFQLKRTGLLGVVKKVAKEGRPLFGICLGMQLLLSMSEEHGHHVGLGLIPGRVIRFTGDAKIPHMGWNTLTKVKPDPLLRGVEQGDYVYFVHSYYAVLQEPEHLLAAGEYAGVTVPAVVGNGNVMGAQFHPEKSGEVGERILRNFVEICTAWRGGERG
jgi:imidazole glycerol-phosphate synthase subunit HisH